MLLDCLKALLKDILLKEKDICFLILFFGNYKNSFLGITQEQSSLLSVVTTVVN